MDLNGAFKTTSRVLFGQEIGNISDFDAYLREPIIGKMVKSAFSGKSIWVTYDYYCDKAKFFDYNSELEKAKTLQKPFDINQIKDIDSLFGAVKERIVYSGNKVLGNSHFVTESDNIFDSSYVHCSSLVFKSKYVAYSYLKRNSEFMFAVTSTGDSSYVMRSFYNTSLKRCFECCTVVNSSDVYFSFYLAGCSNCMFSFNLKNRSNTIGNIQLSASQYSDLKKKLLSEIAEELKTKKKLGYSIMDLFTE